MTNKNETDIVKLAPDIDCTGCTACFSICPNSCIEMTIDSFGFPRPIIDELKCVSCGLCTKACPVIRKELIKTVDGDETYAAYSKDEDTRYTSSSGGIFSEIAKTILDQGGVIWGAAYDEKYVVRHIAVKSASDLYKLQGAKYSQSVLGNTFKQIKQQLINGSRVLFCGTPCQVYGLKGYLAKDYKNLVCIDFVCHSIPSPYAWSKYLDYRSKCDCEGKLPNTVNMRSKISGWSHYGYSVLIDYGREKYAAKSNQDLYMKLFVGGYISRPSCTNCNFKGFKRASDLTLGDCWGVWDFAPDMDDNKGTSLIIVHSETGKELLSKILSKIVVRKISHEEALAANKAIAISHKAIPDSDKSLKLAVAGNYNELKRMLEKKQGIKLFKEKIRRIFNAYNSRKNKV